MTPDDEDPRADTSAQLDALISARALVQALAQHAGLEHHGEGHVPVDSPSHVHDLVVDCSCGMRYLPRGELVATFSAPLDEVIAALQVIERAAGRHRQAQCNHQIYDAVCVLDGSKP